MVDWHNYIHTDTGILHGKPVIKGTRLAVDFILELLANGWTEQQILDNYPGLSEQALQAVFAFSAEYLRDESLFQLQA